MHAGARQTRSQQQALNAYTCKFADCNPYMVTQTTLHHTATLTLPAKNAARDKPHKFLVCVCTCQRKPGKQCNVRAALQAVTLKPHSSKTSRLPLKEATRCWKAALLRRMLLNLSCSGSRYTLAKYFCIVWKQVVTPALLSGCAFFSWTSFCLSFSMTACSDNTYSAYCRHKYMSLRQHRT